MTTEEDGNTLDGTPPERFAPELERRGATVIGVNCAVGPAPMLETIERMEAVTRAAAVGAAQRRQAARRRGTQHLPVLARVHGVVRAAVHPAQRAASSAAAAARRPSTSGRSRRPSRGRRAVAPTRRPRRPARPAARPADRGARPSPREQKSRLARAAGARRVRRRRRAAAAARASRPSRRSSARASSSATASTSSTSPTASAPGARLSALSLAVLIEQQAGIETLLHYACRDRNLLGIQSDLLGAHAMGLRNLLLITGDPGPRRRLSGRDRRLRRRFDRPDQRRVAAEPRLRRRRPGDRRADRLSHRRVGQPGGLEPRRGAAPVRLQGRGRRRVRPDAADLRRRRRSSAFLKRIEAARLPVVAGDLSVRERAERRVHGQRSAGRARARTRCSSGCGGRTAGRGRGRGDRDRPGDRRGAAAGACRACRCRHPSGNIDAALAVVDGLR